METRSDEKKMIKMLIRHWQIAGLTRPDTETFTDHNLACSLQSVVNPFHSKLRTLVSNKPEFSAGFFFVFVPLTVTINDEKTGEIMMFSPTQCRRYCKLILIIQIFTTVLLQIRVFHNKQFWVIRLILNWTLPFVGTSFWR